MNKSENIDQIVLALSKTQAEIKNLPKTAKNPYYHSMYTPLDAVLGMAREIWSKHGLTILQLPCTLEGQDSIYIFVGHESGQWMETEPMATHPVPRYDEDRDIEIPTPQAGGSAITYGRRYTLCALLGIAGEDDDDAEIGEARKPAKKPAKKLEGPSTEKQWKLMASLERELFNDEQLEEYKSKYKFESHKELSKDQASWLIDKLLKQGKDKAVALMFDLSKAMGQEDKDTINEQLASGETKDLIYAIKALEAIVDMQRTEDEPKR